MSHAASPVAAATAISAAATDDNSLFVDILQEAPLSFHRQHTSIFGSIFYCFLLAGYAAVAAAAPWIFFFVPKLISTLLCSCNVILLIITGTALMLLVAVWQPHLHILSLSTLLRIVMLAEVICAGCFMSVYIGCVHQYNSLNGQPDVLKSLYSALQPSSSLEELRYRDGVRLSDQQMALLQYQRENLHYLSEEVLRLQECLSKYQRSDDGSTSQVDLAHLLAARDQELRALSAEMNQVQSELRLARNLIAERDSEIQRIRVTNNQYIEENERLRAILSEWSARAAKLERALETERVSNMGLQKSISKLRVQAAPTRPVEEQ